MIPRLPANLPPSSAIADASKSPCPGDDAGVRFARTARQATLFGIASLCCSLLPAGDWPQWRGPSRDGQVQQPLPASVAENSLTEVWSVPLGPSYSGPIIAGDLVITTETIDKKTESVRAFHRETGAPVWQAEWPGSMTVPFFAAANGSWIRSTPACDGDAVYVAGMRDLLVCLDLRSGAVRWKQDLMQAFDAPLPAFGFVASPLIVGDAVFVQAGGGLVKLVKSTGEVLWRTLEDGGGMYGSAFSSPTIATVDGVEQLIVQTREHLAGVDASSGTVLWKQEVPAFRGMNILTPIVHQGSIFTSSYGGATFLFRPQQTAAGWTVEKVWENRSQGYMSTPVVIDGHVYMHLKNQRFTCINLQTGAQTWTSKTFGKYSSLISDGRQILALDERGDLLRIAADAAEFRLLESRHLTDEPAWAHVAVVDSGVYVRSLDRLTAYRSGLTPMGR